MATAATDGGVHVNDRKEDDTAPADATKKEEHLTKLPAELRNSIYELVVIEDGLIDIVDRRRQIQGGPDSPTTPNSRASPRSVDSFAMKSSRSSTGRTPSSLTHMIIGV